MSDIRQYGTGSGGIGRSAIDLTLRGLFETEARMASFVLENANSPLSVDEVVLAAAETEITVPTNAGGLVIVPAATNTEGIGIMGATGETGIQLGTIIPAVLSFKATPPASIFLTWAGSTYDEEAVTASDTTDKISLTAHTFNDGDRVKFSATTLPGGLEAEVWYYVVSKATDDFKVSTTNGGAAIDLLTTGTAVKVTSSQHFILYWV